MKTVSSNYFELFCLLKKKEFERTFGFREVFMDLVEDPPVTRRRSSLVELLALMRLKLQFELLD